MNVQISISAQVADSILEAAMERINLAAQNKPDWEKHKIYHYYKAECHIPEEDIVPVLNELIVKYPELDISALYSYDVREGDTSAQWWGTTKITTKHHPDGTAALEIDSSTNWF